MNHKPPFILAILILFTSLQSYALDFFGVPICGTIDEMTEKLKPLGFIPATAIAKEGDHAGEEVIFGTDKFRFLKGRMCDLEVSICLSAPLGSSVESIVFERKFGTKEALEKFSLSLLEKITDVYGSPSFCIVKKLLPIDELLKLREKYGNSIPDIVAEWKQTDGVILMQADYSDKSLLCNFDNPTEDQDINQ